MSDRNKLPWMQYDPVIVSESYEGLSDTGIGAYTRLVKMLWVKGPLTETEVRLAIPEQAEAILPRMTRADDRLSFDWLIVAASKSNKVSEEQSGRAVRGWEKRRLKDAGAMPGHNSGQAVGNTMGLQPAMQNRDNRIENREREKEEENTPVPVVDQVSGQPLDHSSLNGQTPTLPPKSKRPKKEKVPPEPEVYFSECGITSEDAAAHPAHKKWEDQKVNWEYYTNLISDWSDKSSTLRTRRGWMSSYRKFLEGDEEKGKLKLRPKEWGLPPGFVYKETGLILPPELQ